MEVWSDGTTSGELCEAELMWLADARRQKVELQDWICAQRGSAPLSCDAKPQLTSSVIMKSQEERRSKRQLVQIGRTVPRHLPISQGLRRYNMQSCCWETVAFQDFFFCWIHQEDCLQLGNIYCKDKSVLFRTGPGLQSSVSPILAAICPNFTRDLQAQTLHGFTGSNFTRDLQAQAPAREAFCASNKL